MQKSLSVAVLVLLVACTQAIGNPIAKIIRSIPLPPIITTVNAPEPGGPIYDPDGNVIGTAPSTPVVPPEPASDTPENREDYVSTSPVAEPDITPLRDKQENVANQWQGEAFAITRGLNDDMMPDVDLLGVDHLRCGNGELYQAWWPEKFQRGGAHVIADYDDPRDFTYFELNGDYDLFGDGSVVTISTPGHTLGHQSVKVKLHDTGTVLLTQDAVWVKENLEGHPAGLNYSILDYMNSVNQIKMIRDIENAQMWLGHSMEQYEAMGEKWYQ